MAQIWVRHLGLPDLPSGTRRAGCAREERYLEPKVGREFLDYKARVRRWI